MITESDCAICERLFKVATGKDATFQYEDYENPGRENTHTRQSYIDWLEGLAAKTLRATNGS